MSSVLLPVSVFSSDEKLKFHVGRIYPIPMPGCGWHIEFYSNDKTKSVFLGDLDSVLGMYSFLTTEYKFERTNLGHYDEDKADFIIDYIGRNSYEIPYMVTSVKIFFVFVENGVYKKVYYEVA